MSELWSSQQHEWLTALGHTLYVQGTAEALAAPEPVAPRHPPASPAAARRAPRPEPAAIIALWPPSHELRGNPAAKRALWPQLRALRRIALS